MPLTVAFFPPRLMSGGTQRHLLEVLKFLDRRRFEPVVLVAKAGGELGEAMARCDVEIVDLALGERLLSADFVRCVRAAARVLRQRHVDVVQCFQWRPALLAIVAASLARRGRIVAGRRSEPVQHGLRGVLEELVVRVADRVIVNAEALRPSGRAARRTDVIPSGVDTEHFQPRPDESATARARLGLPAGGLVVGTVARLEHRKGADTLLEAAARLGAHGVGDWQLVVAGDGPDRTALTALAARLGIAERVTLLGARSDVREVLAALDVFVLPSRTEGMSNALLEALAMARPVIGTAVGGTPEVVTDGETGLLVAAEDPAAMAAAVARIGASPERAAALGAAGRARVVERYGARAMVRRIEAVYEEVVTRAGTVHAERAAA